MDCHNKVDHVFLHPGQFVIATADCMVYTVLDSCVSIVLWHPDKKIGAMSHAVIPTRANDGRFPPSSRYGDEVLPLMLRELELAGVNPLECKARIYGGGNVFPAGAAPAVQAIGRENAEMARRQLADHGIQVSDESLFGKCYRRVEFNVDSGAVHVHPVGVAAAADSMAV